MEGDGGSTEELLHPAVGANVRYIQQNVPPPPHPLEKSDIFRTLAFFQGQGKCQIYPAKCHPPPSPLGKSQIYLELWPFFRKFENYFIRCQKGNNFSGK